jgi:histidinol-phosphatase (PHP family)
MFPTCDYHTHPQGHNVRSYTIDLLQPWIEQCRAKEIQSIAFTDHDRYIAGVDFAVIDRLREQNPDVQILAGIELDNDPLTSDSGVRWVESNWDRLDFVLGSVHYFSGETEMLDRAGEAGQIESRGLSEAFDQYGRELEKLISRGHIDCLSHLDLVKIHGLLPGNYDPAKLFGPILELAKRAGLAIEASTAGWRKAVGEQYPHLSILKLAVALDIPITTASDAHSSVQVADHYERLAKVLASAGVTETVTFERHQCRRQEFRSYRSSGVAESGGRLSGRWKVTNRPPCVEGLLNSWIPGSFQAACHLYVSR